MKLALFVAITIFAFFAQCAFEMVRDEKTSLERNVMRGIGMVFLFLIIWFARLSVNA